VIRTRREKEKRRERKTERERERVRESIAHDFGGVGSAAGVFHPRTRKTRKTVHFPFLLLSPGRIATGGTGVGALLKKAIRFRDERHR